MAKKAKTEPYHVVKVEILLVFASLGWTVVLLWDRGVGRLYGLESLLSKEVKQESSSFRPHT